MRPVGRRRRHGPAVGHRRRARHLEPRSAARSTYPQAERRQGRGDGIGEAVRRGRGEQAVTKLRRHRARRAQTARRGDRAVPEGGQARGKRARSVRRCASLCRRGPRQLLHPGIQQPGASRPHEGAGRLQGARRTTAGGGRRSAAQSPARARSR